MRTTRSVEPFLSIDVEVPTSHKISIAELTVNPVLEERKNRNSLQGSLWLEVVIEIENYPPETGPKLPEVVVQLRDFDAASRRPNNQLAWSGGAGVVDLNKMFYSEIWSSFIPPHDARGDFMATGYREAKRIVSESVSYQHLVAEFERQRVPGSQHPQDLCLSDLVNRFELLEHYYTKIAGPGSSSSATLPKGVAYQGTKIEVAPDLPAGTLAFERKPWSREGSSGSFRTIPCSVSLAKTGLAWRLAPSLIANDPDLPREFSGKVAIAFWLHFPKAQCAVDHDYAGSLTYQLDIRSNLGIRDFNTFFRVPRSLAFQDGALTSLKRYAAPPRLFTHWDKYLDFDCYSHHLSDLAPDHVTSINADFSYAKEQIEKISTIFILGLVASIISALSINVFTMKFLSLSGEGALEFLIPGGQQRISADWILLGAVLSTAAIAFLIRKAHGARFLRWRLAMFGVTLALLLPVLVGFLLRATS